MNMDTKDFYKLSGLKETDEVTVNALQLQGFMREMDRLSKVEQILETTEKENNDLRDEVKLLRDALDILDSKLEKCYDENEVLFEDNLSKAALIKTYKKQMGEISSISSNNTRLKREHTEMKNKLYSMQALSSYRSNERRYSKYLNGNGGDNIRVDLKH